MNTKIKNHVAKVVAIFVQSILFGMACLASGQDCCREAKVRVHFDTPAIHPNPTWDSTVVSIGDSMGKSTTVIRVLNSARDPYFRSGEFMYLASHDNGETWEGVAGDQYSPVMSPTGNLIASPSDASILYRKTNIFGVYLRSNDGGRTWSLPQYKIGGMSREAFVREISKDARYFLSSQIVAIDPHQPLTVYASFAAIPWGALFGSLTLPIRAPEEVYVTHDGGDEWVKFSPALSAKCPVAISPSNSKVMLGCTTAGLVRTTNGGLNWEDVPARKQLEQPPIVNEPEHGEEVWSGWNGLDIMQIIFDPANEKIVYLITNKGIFRSVDGTATWCLLNLGLDELEVVNNAAISQGKPTEIAVGTKYGVFLSIDRGCHFQRIYPAAEQKK